MSKNREQHRPHRSDELTEIAANLASYLMMMLITTMKVVRTDSSEEEDNLEEEPFLDSESEFCPYQNDLGKED